MDNVEERQSIGEREHLVHGASQVICKGTGSALTQYRSRSQYVPGTDFPCTLKAR